MNWFKQHKIISVALGVIILVLVVVIVIAIIPQNVEPTVTSDPAGSYEEANARIQDIQAVENQIADLNPTCATRLLSHGEKTEKAIVFLHGFTSCPEQFEVLGEEFHSRGYNVYIPRMPGHGLEDRLGAGLETLTAEGLADFGTQTADIAQGLGEHVTIAGLSGGGSVTVWLAQERSDVDLAAPIAPFVGVGFIPAALNQPFANLLIAAPDFFQWWDPVQKEHNPLSSAYQYVRYPTHALADFLELGFTAKDDAGNSPPAAGSILVITNGGDEAINEKVVSDFVDSWKKQGYDVGTFQFSKELNQPHDIITPGRPDNDTSLIYPKLLELLGGPIEPLEEDESPTDEETGDQSDTESLALIDQPWGWVAFTDPLQQFEIPDPENYVIEFSDDGTLQVKADCNIAQGTYTSNGRSISIEFGPTSLAACPQGSRSEEFLQKLGFVAIYFFQDDHLFIDMFADGGTFKFTPIASPETETDIPSEPDTDHIEDQSAALFELLRFRNYRTKKGVELGEHSILWEIIRQYIGNQDDGFRELNHTNDPLYEGFKYS